MNSSTAHLKMSQNDSAFSKSVDIYLCVCMYSYCKKVLKTPRRKVNNNILLFQRLGDEMPVSLQNNLSELDTLLADLNNAK